MRLWQLILHRDVSLLYRLNELAVRFSLLQHPIIWLAMLGLLGPIACFCVKLALTPSRFKLRCVAGAWCLAWTGATCLVIMRYWWVRPRPFLFHKVVPLAAVPNDASFPSLPVALGTALLVVALWRGGRAQWAAGAALLLAWCAARAATGIEYPSDAAAGMMIGAICATATLSWLEGTAAAKPWIQRRPRSSVVMGLLLAGFGAAIILKRAPAGRVGPVMAVPAASAIKGYEPRREARLLAALRATNPPVPIMNVAVGSDGVASVAALKLLANTAPPNPWPGIERDAARALRAVFLADPTLSEADLWSVVVEKTDSGEIIHRVVFSVDARRADAALLLDPKTDLASEDPNRLLAAFGQRFETQRLR